MRPFWEDLRFGLRLLWRHPGFSVLALLTLTLGIGANTAVFSIVRGVLLKPLPYRQPEQLLWIGGREARFAAEDSGVSIPDLYELRQRSKTISAIAAYNFFPDKLVLTGTGEPEQVDGFRVTVNFFDVLGVPPVAGRAFQASEDQLGAPRVVVLSHELWLSRYAADPAIIGRTLTLNAISYQIIGVMPEGFQLPSRVGVWLPILVNPQTLTQRDYHSYLCFGRLAANANPLLAAQELAAFSAEFERSYPATNTGFRFESKPLSERISGPIRDTLYLLTGVTAFLLLISAANVANLLLSRATARRREIAIRHALGASRFAILRQLAAESLVIALAGGAFGTLLAWWMIRLLRAWNPASLPRASELALDPVSLLFALLLSVSTALLFGLAPALQATRSNQQDALRDVGTRGGGEGAGRVQLRGWLVIGEIAIAIVLLSGAGLLLESVTRLLAVDPGFRAAGVLTTEITLPRRKFRTLDTSAAFVDTYLTQLRALPGVQSAGAAMGLPMGSVFSYFEFRIAGDAPVGAAPYAGYTSVTPGYFEAMGIPLRDGRYFDARDSRDAPKAVIISEPMARQFFSGSSPLGRRLRIDVGGPEWLEGEIVGIVGGVRHDNLAQPPRVELYVPLAQNPLPVANILVRSNQPREALVNAMRQTLKSLDRDLPIYRIRTMEEVVLESAAGPRARGFLTALFALTALLLASVGIYSVMSYSVSRRSQEIGIRMAVGSTPGAIVGMILMGSSRLVLLGMAAGLAVSIVLGRLLNHLLFGVSSFDAAVLAKVCALLAGVALAATSIPAWRAARIDPLRALRQD
jgi:putative ABC transport system permease protein